MPANHDEIVKRAEMLRDLSAEPESLQRAIQRAKHTLQDASKSPPRLSPSRLFTRRWELFGTGMAAVLALAVVWSLQTRPASAAEELQHALEQIRERTDWLEYRRMPGQEDPNSPFKDVIQYSNLHDGRSITRIVDPNGVTHISLGDPVAGRFQRYDSATNLLTESQMPPNHAARRRLTSIADFIEMLGDHRAIQEVKRSINGESQRYDVYYDLSVVDESDPSPPIPLVKTSLWFDMTSGDLTRLQHDAGEDGMHDLRVRRVVLRDIYDAGVPRDAQIAANLGQATAATDIKPLISQIKAAVTWRLDCEVIVITASYIGEESTLTPWYLYVLEDDGVTVEQRSFYVGHQRRLDKANLRPLVEDDWPNLDIDRIRELTRDAEFYERIQITDGVVTFNGMYGSAKMMVSDMPTMLMRRTWGPLLSLDDREITDIDLLGQPDDGQSLRIRRKIEDLYGKKGIVTSVIIYDPEHHFGALSYTTADPHITHNFNIRGWQQTEGGRWWPRTVIESCIVSLRDSEPKTSHRQYDILLGR